jgi:hypothetical protein
MPISLGQAIGRLENLKKSLASTRPFFIHHLTEWLEMARTSARGVLMERVPEGIEPAEWYRQVDYTIGLINAQLLGGDASGILLFLGREQASFEGFADTVNVVLSGEVTLRDIEEYVQAGLEGDPAGKPDITPEDRTRTALQTAFLIRKAIAAGRTNRDEQVAAFINARMQRSAAKDYYPAILDVWRETFTLVAYDALKRWVAATARREL